MNSFQTERLLAERLCPENLPDYRRLFQDPRVMATLSATGEVLTDDDVAQWLGRGLQNWDRCGFGNWVFRHKVDRKLVGRAGLKQVEIEGQQEVELGYALVPEFWGQGLATEIAEAILDLALTHFGLTQVVAYTLRTNRASQRVMEKAGFRFEKEFVRADLPHVLYRMDAAGYAARRRG